MKKLLKSIALIGVIIVIALIAVFTLVIKFSLNKNMKSDINYDIKLEAITADEGNRIELNILNNSRGTILCDLKYEIQICKGNMWNNCTGEIAVDALGIEILPNESSVQNIVLADTDIDKGKTYRIKKVIGGYEYYSNEFIIE